MNGFGIVRLIGDNKPYFAEFYGKEMSGGNLAIVDSLVRSYRYNISEDWITNLLTPHSLVRWSEE